MTTCINCKHFNLKSDPTMARLGFASCQNSDKNNINGLPITFFVSRDRKPCGNLIEVDALTFSNRSEWLSRQK